MSLYDAGTHTYSWFFESVAPNYMRCFKVVVRVKQDVESGQIITNRATLDGRGLATVSIPVSVVTKMNPLTLTKTVVMDPNVVLVGDTYQVDPGSLVTYELCVGNPANTTPVKDVVLLDKLPQEVEFISADIGGVSYYDPVAHTYSWYFDSVEPNYVGCFRIVVRVKDDVSPGQIITNEAILNGLGIATVSIPVSVVTKQHTLFLATPIIYYAAPLLRNDRKSELIFDFGFPSDIMLADIDTTQPLTLTPGNAKAYEIKSVSSAVRTTYKVFGADGKVRIEALFDRQPVLDTLQPGQATVTLTVAGKFVTGRQFISSITIPVQ
jgi:uncharacterized repeat protein (TIGR01451 family)